MLLSLRRSISRLWTDLLDLGLPIGIGVTFVVASTCFVLFLCLYFLLEWKPLNCNSYGLDQDDGHHLVLECSI